MEFELIRKFFSEPFSALSERNQSRVLMGIGDDCAVFRPHSDYNLYVSTDTSVSGVHFFADEDPVSVGWKALAVNLSDLAASGAKPLGFTLNLSLPQLDTAWLSAFSKGLLKQAEQANCPLVGGDTTSTLSGSPLVITITVFGERHCDSNCLARSAAQEEDQLWVTGIPGLARLGLLQRYDRLGQLPALLHESRQALFRQTWDTLPALIQEQALTRLSRPHIRTQFALKASALMHAALDLSDGLSGDMQHIAQASSKTLVIQDVSLRAMWSGMRGISALVSKPLLLDFLVQTSLIGGDDYELCFTAPSEHADNLAELAQAMQIGLCCIGQVRGSGSLPHGVVLQHATGQETALRSNSFNHFAP